jgi:hypothetical protein
MSGRQYIHHQPIQLQPQPMQQIQPQQQQIITRPLPPQQPVFPMYQGPSPNTQGFFSAYSARIKKSQDNALLLPASYIMGKRQRHGDDSDEEFEDLLENSDNDDKAEPQGRMTRSSTAIAADAEAKSFAATQEQNRNLPRIAHKKNTMFPSSAQLLEHMSELTETLVPIRLDIDMDEVKLRDVFVWNMNGNYEMFKFEQKDINVFWFRTILDT